MTSLTIWGVMVRHALATEVYENAENVVMNIDNLLFYSVENKLISQIGIVLGEKNQKTFLHCFSSVDI